MLLTKPMNPLPLFSIIDAFDVHSANLFKKSAKNKLIRR
jgi:hypothetical protein